MDNRVVTRNLGESNSDFPIVINKDGYYEYNKGKKQTCFNDCT